MRSQGHLRGHLRVAMLALVTALGLTAPSARADDKQVCLAAYERAQQLRMDTKLRAARDQLAICSRAECPALVRQDCSQWMTEVMQSVPSVVVAARDALGHDVFAVRVSVDNAIVTERLDGKPLALDPGPHHVKYETSGFPAIEEQVLIREGEQNRPLTVVFKDVDTRPAPTKPVDDKTATSEDTTPSEPKPPILAYSLIGVGVLALGAALYFDLRANSDAQTLRDVCKPNCTQSDVDAVQAKYVAAGVSLGVGIAAVGVGTVLLLVRPKAKAHQASWTFDAAPTRGGAAASFGAVF